MQYIFFFLKKIKENAYSLKTKLVLSVLLLLGLFIAIILINNILVNSIIINKTNQLILNSVKQANLSLEYVFLQAKEQAYQLSVQVTERDDIESLLSRDDAVLNDYEEYDITRQYIKELTKIGIASRVDSVYVYSDLRKKLITSIYGVFRYEDVKDNDWIKYALSFKGDNALAWVGNCHYLNVPLDQYSKLISLICREHIVNRNIKSEVYLGMNFDEDKIYSIFKDIAITPDTLVYLTDENGVIISAGLKKSIGRNLSEVVGSDISIGHNAYPARVKIDREYYQMIVVKNSIAGWSLMALMPEKELFAERRAYWTVVLLSLCVVSAFIIFIAYRTIVRYVDRPVIKLIKIMKLAEKGDFNVSIGERRRDEFGALYTGFNEMVGKINILIRELYQEKLLSRDIELKYLQKLINPHFLYNSLDTLSCLAKENRLSDVTNMAFALSNLYRTTFNRGQEYITIGSCISNVEDYLYIQKVRYGSTFSCIIDLDEETKEYVILNLLLQPVVENALIHGIRKKGNPGGVIRIRVRKNDNLICISVLDNGIGIRRDKLKIIRASIKSGNKNNDSGIRIVYQRIKLFYGDKYGMRINSTYRRGTCVSFSFPAYEYLDNGNLSGKSVCIPPSLLPAILPEMGDGMNPSL